MHAPNRDPDDPEIPELSDYMLWGHDLVATRGDEHEQSSDRDLAGEVSDFLWPTQA